MVDMSDNGRVEFRTKVTDCGSKIGLAVYVGERDDPDFWRAAWYVSEETARALARDLNKCADTVRPVQNEG